jgi:hypothetical protein
MGRQIVNIGVEGNDASGDPIRAAFKKINDNFNELYSAVGQGAGISFTNLREGPDEIVPSSILIANVAANKYISKTLEGQGITIDNSDPTKMKFISTASNLSNDIAPALANDLNAGTFTIYRLSNPSTLLATQYNVNIDSFAINKGYADSRYLQLAGGTMTGQLILSGPISGGDNPLIATTKEYVDTLFLNNIGPTGPTGPIGSAVNIQGSVNSVPELPGYPSGYLGNIGDGYLVGGDLWVWSGSGWDNLGNIQGPQGTTGPIGPTGPIGSAVNIQGSVNSVPELPGYPSGYLGNIGDGYLVGGDLWVWSGGGWDNLGNIQGPQGNIGPTGPSGLQGATGPTGLAGNVGPTGPTGEMGPGVLIQGSVNTYTELPGYPSGYMGNIGDSYLVGNSGDLWSWTGGGWTQAGNIQGPQGTVGPTGPTGSFQSYNDFTTFFEAWAAQLPTTPGSPGQAWNNNGVITIS